jgi:hypothetical protein
LTDTKPRAIRCTICGTRVRDGEPSVVCDGCNESYHEDCWASIEGCATYGCAKAPVPDKAPPAAIVGAGWGDAKACPSCAVEIPSSLLVCRACKAQFPWADPMTVEEYQTWLGREASLRTQRRVLTALFIGAMTCIGSPIAGPIAGIYAFLKRRTLVGQDGVYVAMGYGSAVLGVVYGVVLLLVRVR